jgi:hypothetical protein
MIATAPAAAQRWHVVTEPLAGWRDDDPDAYPRCAINPEHRIENGDHYALSGLKMACLDCARVAPPPTPPDPVVTPRARPNASTGKRWGEPAPQSRPATAPRPSAPAVVAPLPAPAPETVPAVPATPRISLGPSHRDYGTPIGPPPPRRRIREERTCPICERYCGQVCGNQGAQRARLAARSTEAAPAPAPVAVVEATAPEPADGPAPHDIHACPCFECAGRRVASGVPPLPIRIGGYVLAAPKQGETDVPTRPTVR